MDVARNTERPIFPRGYEEGSGVGYGMGEIQRDGNYALEYGRSPSPTEAVCCGTAGLQEEEMAQQKLQEFQKKRKRSMKKQCHLTSIKSRLKVMTKGRYEDTHKGRIPERDGVKMKRMKIDG